MKLLFRRKRDGYLMRPIQTMAKYVRLRHVHSGLECMTTKANLPEGYDVLTHDIERGDVLRDIRDGQLWVVECAGFNNLRIQTRMGGVSGNMIRGMTYFGLIHYERVGRKYRLRKRHQHERATHDKRKVREHIDNARAQAAAMIQAGNDAKRFGIGVPLVYPDGSMKSTDPRGVILK